MSAVVLTLGEAYTERALESLSVQTLPPAETIVVRGVSPFHRAVNHGAARVRTEFFVQVDADMILDPDCIAGLRARCEPGVAMVHAALRDPLEGLISGVKLWRTRCFRDAFMRDTISPDTELVSDLKAAGWRRATVGPSNAANDVLPSLGRHEPDYTPLYTYSRFRLLGARYRWRGHLPALRARFARLQRSPHPAAGFAQLGVTEGVYWRESRDRLEPYTTNEGDERLLALPLQSAVGVRAPLPSEALPRKKIHAFEQLYDLGLELAADFDGAALRAQLEALADRSDPAGFAGAFGLCRGALHALRGETSWERERAAAVEFFAEAFLNARVAEHVRL